MKKPLFLWGTLRSTSTAFEWMIRQRGDFSVMHEPFGKAYYYSPERQSNRYANVKIQPESCYASIISMIQENNKFRRVFVKDMAFYVSHMLSDNFFQNFDNTFIIRHPAKVLPSLFDKWPNFTFEEAGYEALYCLFRKIEKITYKIPPIIDSDDLLSEPNHIVKSYCNKLEIPFISEALEWSNQARPEIYWDSNIWHSQVERSRGFEKQYKNNYVNIHENSYLNKMYHLCLPFYQKLYDYRIY